MGNINYAGLCQEVASWQRKHQLERAPSPDWMQARTSGSSGPFYLQNEQMSQWRPTRGAPSSQSSPAIKHEPPKLNGQRGPHSAAGQPSKEWDQSRPDGFNARGRHPVRQSSADTVVRQCSTGPVRQFSAPVRQSSIGRPRHRGSQSHRRIGDSPVLREFDGLSPQRAAGLQHARSQPRSPDHWSLGPWSPGLRLPGSRTPRSPEGLGFKACEDHPLCAQPAGGSRAQAPELPGSWGPAWGPEDLGLPSEKRAEEAWANHALEDDLRTSSRTPQDAREKSPPRIEDTAIGKGLSEFLKRGVAQAAPKKTVERAEMVPSKDGGFIATIQRGFEGIFGHLAASKEEVLKKRGPMPAPEYEAVPGDDIDQRVQHCARQLPTHLGDCLTIYRISRGEYEIGNDEVHLEWQSKLAPPNLQSPKGVIIKEVFVFMTSKEDASGTNPNSKDGEGWNAAQIPCEPLPFYLRHSANVAYDLQYGSKVTKVPESSRLSFAEETGTLLKDGDADAKFNAMTLAIQQAKKREQAAVEWRRRNVDGVASSATSRDSCDNGAKPWSSFDDPKVSPRSARTKPPEAADPLAAAGSPPQGFCPGPCPAAPCMDQGQPLLPPPPPDMATGPVLLGSGPIPGLDPPQLKLPPARPMHLAWAQPEAHEVHALQPPIRLTGLQGLQNSRIPQFVR